MLWVPLLVKSFWFGRLRRIPRLECCEGSWEMMILVILLNKLNWSVQVIQFQVNYSLCACLDYPSYCLCFDSR
ncbi:hypothetical protein MTR_3g022000 [Medicago truncatula]|uniref:Uncharacterized protein n=1 Tax=Medicago truncatula TaxID=3880 RepID=A0A072UTX2_MEDTR|nr:hypothetical protein MTR_3g022000 [Medicago truncatula]